MLTNLKFKKLEKLIYQLISRSPVGLVGHYSVNKQPRIILAYHGVDYNHPLCLAPNIFREHMIYLKNNYNITLLENIIEPRINGEKPLISITFDDAFANLMKNAIPFLLEQNIPAIIYAPTGWLGKNNGWDAHNNAIPLIPIMTPHDLNEIRAMGFDIGSHTQNHLRLKGLDHNTLKCELVDSKKKLEDITGRPIISLAYPFGGRSDIDQKAVNLAQDAGYLTAVTTYFGRHNSTDRRYELRRIIITPSDSLRELQLKLTGYYDWITLKEIIFHLIRSIKN
jgi:peptidoglycan/xylan/chitin deacetylase (PgdA/CDA1 family)